MIVITRHGKYVREPGQDDGHLSADGRRETETVATIFRDYIQKPERPMRRIFCSPLIRSKETADIFLLKEIGKSDWTEVIEDPRLADPKMSLDQHFEMVSQHPKFPTGVVYAILPQPEEFEEYEEVAQRFCDFLTELVEGLGKETVLVVTHAPCPDYLLLQHFRKTGLCWGKDLGHGEFLTIRKSGDRFILGFRGKVMVTDKQGLLFNPRFIQEERRKRGYGN
ncbi:histidine phosphatase family protein [Patescibacteria group bacterium]|nr:histidine phosphatase family protein [Patescibacteria group bacterium]